MKLLIIAFLIACAFDIQAQAKTQAPISKPQSDTTATQTPDSVKVTFDAAEYNELLKALTGAATAITGAKKQSEFLTVPVVIWQVVELINERRTLIYSPAVKAPQKSSAPPAKKVP